MNDSEQNGSSSWNALRKFTSARIALGRTGGSLTTKQLLQFKLDHAKAKDAVEYELDFNSLAKKCSVHIPEIFQLASTAANRNIYLQRPDMGKTLGDDSKSLLKKNNIEYCEIGLAAIDGLSPLALERHLEPLLQALIPKLHGNGLRYSPLFLVQQGRVAIGDEIGEMIKCKIIIVIIGERPGLSAPDSLGIYITYNPKIGLTDESRNCISNVRNEGLPPRLTAEKLLYLLKESLRLKLSGVNLKDESGSNFIQA